MLRLKVEAVQGKQFSLEWTETSGRLWEWWHDPRVSLAFPVESASSGDATGMPGNSFPTTQGKDPFSSYEVETGLLWMWAGLSCFLRVETGMPGIFLGCS